MKINGKQGLKLRSGLIKFINCFKQLAVPFQIYADFQSVQKEFIVMMEVLILITQTYIPWSFAYKVVCIDDKFSKPVVLHRGKNAVNKFIEAYLK